MILAIPRPKRVTLAMLAILCFHVAECAQLPDIDTAFLNRNIPVGTAVSEARESVEGRGFSQIPTYPATKFRFNPKTEQFDALPVTFEETVENNVAAVVESNPKGELTCFNRSWIRPLSGGIRLICWTADDMNRITWRQAGVRGGGL